MTEKVMPMGGSDIMLEGLKKYVNLDGINVIQSVCDERLIDLDKKNILWQHLPANQPLVQGISDKYFQRQLDATVMVSHWQHEKYRFMHQIPLSNVVVIKNAIEPIEFIPRSTGRKIKVIYASPPYRGLDVVLASFELLNRDDVELDIYSSTVIYGSDYVKHEGDRYEPLFNKARELPNVNYIGYVPHKEMISAFQNADILAYPCTFEETSCLTVIEAAAAGCKIVTTNIGGLPETGSEFATLVPIQATHLELVSSFSYFLNKVIDEIDSFDGAYQSSFYNKMYDWERRAIEWKSLISML
jgi:glycosyltransferase involved in cell wall biosynthesis